MLFVALEVDNMYEARSEEAKEQAKVLGILGEGIK